MIISVERQYVVQLCDDKYTMTEDEYRQFLEECDTLPRLPIAGEIGWIPEAELMKEREADGEIAYLEAQVMERDVKIADLEEDNIELWKRIDEKTRMIEVLEEDLAETDKLRQALTDCNQDYVKLSMKKTTQDASPSIPVEPEPVPDKEPIPEVIPEPEPQPTPVFNDTAVMETKTEEVTTVEKTKKTKAPSATAFTPEQITRYTKIIQDKEPRKVILAAMMGESGINEGLANNRYYALRDKIQNQKITDSVQAYTDNTVTVITIEPKPLPRSVQAELDAMPVYDTIKAFKNAVCENELLKGYSIAELKEPYRSHRPDQVKW